MNLVDSLAMTCKYLCIDKAKNNSHTKPNRANILCGSIITSSSMLKFIM